MERRVLLAIFLSFLVLYAYQALVVRTPPAAPASEAGTTASSAGSPSPASGPASAASAPAGSPTDPGAPTATPVVGETSERDIRVETPEVVAVFTNRGARLKSWRLKKFKDDKGEPLEIVAGDLQSGQPLPFTLATEDPALTKTLNEALYSATGTGSGPLDASGTPPRVQFEYRDTSGIHAIKEFQFDPAPYVVAFRASVTSGDRPIAPTVEWGPALSLSSREAGSYHRQAGGLFYQDGKLTRITSEDIAETPQQQGNFRYAGVDDHYFVAMAIAPGPSKVDYRTITVPPALGSTEDAPISLVSWSIEDFPPDKPVKFFAGPKDFEVMAGVDRDLVRAIDFGMFAFMVVPLLRSLNWINGYVGNYGWSIVILTVLINVAMFPLRQKSVTSMRKMQEIQPEAKAIQDRYAKLKATDPAKQKMNQELMALYRERGVNPASGCIPMLLTMPVFLAFYALLTVSIELRGAPFFGWIHDLSRPDPLYITPVLMGLSQLWQMRITPQTGADPAQQRMMMAMPIIFMVFFLWTSAGALLYWLVSNIWGIGQQYLTMYLKGPPQVRAVRPPAERQLKRVGAGKTDAASRGE
jgi:YidC/Oxa1 family membrane protein insertase